MELTIPITLPVQYAYAFVISLINTKFSCSIQQFNIFRQKLQEKKIFRKKDSDLI